MTELEWWQSAVFYQIYPRSFADGNGDGIGDLLGIIGRLDYLKDLGIDAIWLSPHYPSPLSDVGYDISDYMDVAPEYGTLEDFQGFLNGAHQRNMRVILDLVMNHTSSQHPWFLESRASVNNPKRDWYIWRAGKDGGPPNNWYSGFGGSAWEYDPQTGQYYYHFFFKEQPDLNWNNPEVKQAMWDSVRFWLDLGVDGFRLDAIDTIFEDLQLTDHPVQQSLIELQAAWLGAGDPKEQQALEEQYQAFFQYQTDLPAVQGLMRELRAVTNQYPGRILVGETDRVCYYGDGSDQLHMVFNFPLMNTNRLTPAWVRHNQQERLSELPSKAWPCNTLGNHDAPRVLSRFSDGRPAAAITRLCMALMLTLRGTPFLYNGEEIGMTDLLLEDIHQFHDNLGIWVYNAAIQEYSLPPAEAIQWANRLGRDKCRTPLQWANAPNAGFSPAGVAPWLPVNPNFAQGINVADQTDDPSSLLSFYRRMLRLRKSTPALIAGDYIPVHETAADYLAFLRKSSAQTCLVVLNMSENPHKLHFDRMSQAARCLFSTIDGRESQVSNLSQFELAPFEVYIGELV